MTRSLHAANRETDTPSGRPVVFFHVMKCGGTSVRAGLTRAAMHEGRGSIFELDGDAAKASVVGKDPENWIFRDALLGYVLRAMRPAIVLGHFRYCDRYAELLDSADFVTVLRDPVERVVSLYKYRRYKDTVDVPVTLSFDEFLASPRWSREGSAYVRTFCGRVDLDPQSDEAIDAAVANLYRFKIVGFTDCLGEFAKRTSTLLGRPVKFDVINTTPAPETPASDGIDDATLAWAKSVCAPDIAVFERARATATSAQP